MSARSSQGSVALGAALLALLFAGAAAGALFAPQFRVQTITVEGGTSLLRAEVEAAARQAVADKARLAGTPRLFLVSREDVATAVKQRLPRVATLRVLRKLPGTLALSLQEKVPVAYFERGGRALALDGEGLAIEETSSEDAARSGLPVVRGLNQGAMVSPGQAVLSRAVIDLLHSVVVELPDRLGITVEALVIPAIGALEVHVETSEGWRLLLDAERDLPVQLRTFEHILSEEIALADRPRLEYVDLRIPGKVFYRFRAGAPRRPAPTGTR